MKPYRNVWHLIGLGKAGWHASGLTDDNIQTTSSGGDLLPYMYIPSNNMQDGYACEAIENALVYDASDCPYDDFTRLVISGPMFNPSLNEWEYEHGILDHTRTLLPLAERECTLESLKALNIRSLSYVDVNIYKQLLSNIPNMKLGYIHNGEVTWQQKSSINSVSAHAPHTTIQDDALKHIL